KHRGRCAIVGVGKAKGSTVNRAPTRRARRHQDRSFGAQHLETDSSRVTLMPLRTKPWSVEARDLYKEGKWIEREVARKTLSKQAEPTILRYIGKLLTLLVWRNDPMSADVEKQVLESH